MEVFCFFLDTERETYSCSAFRQNYKNKKILARQDNGMEVLSHEARSSIHSCRTIDIEEMMRSHAGCKRNVVSIEETLVCIS